MAFRSVLPAFLTLVFVALPLQSVAQDTGCPEAYAAAVEAYAANQMEAVRAAAEALRDCPTATDADRALARYRLAFADYHFSPAQADSTFDRLVAEGIPERLERVERARFVGHRGTYARQTGQVHKAAMGYDEALRLGEDMPLYWRAQRHALLAQQYQAMGLIDLARESAEQGVAIAAEAGNDILTVQTGSTLTSTMLSRFVRALELDHAEGRRIIGRTVSLERLLDQAQAEGARPDAVTLLRRNLLAIRYRTQLEMGLLDEALATARTALYDAGEGRLDTHNRAVLNLVSAHFALGEYAAAEAVLAEFIEGDYGHLGVDIDLNHLIGTLAYVRGDYETAEPYLRVAHDLLNVRTLQVRGSAWTTLELFPYQAVARALSDLLVATGRPEEAFAIYGAQRNRALHAARLARNAPDRPDDEARIAEAQAELSQLRRERVAGTHDPAAFRQRLLSASANLVREAEMIPPPPTDLATLQRTLAAQQRYVVAYSLSADTNIAPSLAFVVGPSTFEAVPLAVSERDLVALAARLPRPGSDGWTEVDPEPLRAIYREVVEPVEAWLPAGSPVTFLPDGALMEVPFALLLSEDVTHRRYAEWPYLLRRHAVSVELSLPEAMPPPIVPPSRSVVAFGRTAFDVPGPDYALLLRSSTGDALPHLPAVRDEIAAVRRFAPRGTFAVDEGATPERLLELISDARVVHLASHVTVSPRALYSSLLLTPSNPTDPRSGDLYFFDLFEREVPADLVVLSGCDSAAGEVRIGEGLMGLHFAFRVAGAASTLGTLWPVDDAAMADLMELFYGELRRGVPSDEALRRAQLAFLESAEGLRSSPMVWGGLVLSGTPGPVELRERPPLPGSDGFRWMLAATLAFGLIGAFLSGRLRS